MCKDPEERDSRAQPPAQPGSVPGVCIAETLGLSEFPGWQGLSVDFIRGVGVGGVETTEGFEQGHNVISFAPREAPSG